MMLLLIRHGDCDPVGKMIAGRLPGISLNSNGEKQVFELTRMLDSIAIEAIYASPLERSIETASPVALSHGLNVSLCEKLNEIEYGAWTGKTFARLSEDPGWHEFNNRRSLTRIPDGELMIEVQARMCSQVEEIRSSGKTRIACIVSHGDPIKTVLFHYLGVSLDAMNRIEISPASASIMGIDAFGARVFCINEQRSIESQLKWALQ